MESFIRRAICPAESPSSLQREKLINTMKLINDFELRERLETSVCQAVVRELQPMLPADVHEIGWILKYYGINHRLDFTRGGQDCSTSRVNVETDGRQMVKSLEIG